MAIFMGQSVPIISCYFRIEMMNEWFILPGMGATAAMYDSLRREMSFSVSFVNWPAYSGESTYKEIAQRIINENSIHTGDVIGGSSLGGMVALEIAQLIQPKAVILI
jgi:surfactin synthase thioesterase subunit